MKVSLRPKYQLGGNVGSPYTGRATLSGFNAKPTMDFNFKGGSINANPYSKWQTPSIGNINSYKAPTAFSEMNPGLGVKGAEGIKGGAIGGVMGGVKSIGEGINIKKAYDPLLDSIEDANKRHLKSREFQGQQNINNQPRTQSDPYGNYPRQFQYGGYPGYGQGPLANPHAGTYDTSLANVSAANVRENRDADIAVNTFENVGAGVADGVSDAMGSVPIIGATVETKNMIHGFTGREKIVNPETGKIDTVYDKPEQALPSEFTQDAGSHTIDDFAQGDIGGGFANLFTGGLYGKIGGGIEAQEATRSRDAREAKYKKKSSFGRTLGDVTYSNGSFIPEAATGGEFGGQKIEVEDKEVVENAMGNYETKRGNKHNNHDPKTSGIKITAKEGDYVWSELGGFASRFKKLSDAGDTVGIEMLRAEQEAWAGRQPGQAGGEIPRRQYGTPGSGIVGHPNYLPDWRLRQQASDLSLYGVAQPSIGYNAVMPGVVPSTTSTTSTSTPAKKKVRDKSKDEKMTPMPFQSNHVQTPFLKQPVQVTTNVPQAAMPAAPSTYPTSASVSPSNKYGRTATGRFLKDNKAELLAGAGAILQAGMTLGQKNAKLDPLNPGAPVKSDVAHYTRVRDMEEGARQADLRSATNAALTSGAGPGAIPEIARATMQKTRAGEAAAGRIAQQNANIDMAEQQFNIGNKRLDSIENRNTALQVQAANRADALREQSFKNDQLASLGDIGSGAVKDYLAYNADRDLAGSIYGNTGIQTRALKGKESKFYSDYKKNNPQATDAEINRAWLDELSKIV